MPPATVCFRDKLTAWLGDLQLPPANLDALADDVDALERDIESATAAAQRMPARVAAPRDAAEHVVTIRLVATLMLRAACGTEREKSVHAMARILAGRPALSRAFRRQLDYQEAPDRLRGAFEDATARAARITARDHG